MTVIGGGVLFLMSEVPFYIQRRPGDATPLKGQDGNSRGYAALPPGSGFEIQSFGEMFACEMGLQIDVGTIARGFLPRCLATRWATNRSNLPDPRAMPSKIVPDKAFMSTFSG